MYIIASHAVLILQWHERNECRNRTARAIQDGKRSCIDSRKHIPQLSEQSEPASSLVDQNGSASEDGSEAPDRVKAGGARGPALHVTGGARLLLQADLLSLSCLSAFVVCIYNSLPRFQTFKFAI